MSHVLTLPRKVAASWQQCLTTLGNCDQRQNCTPRRSRCARRAMGSPYQVLTRAAAFSQSVAAAAFSQSVAARGAREGLSSGQSHGQRLATKRFGLLRCYPTRARLEAYASLHAKRGSNGKRISSVKLWSELASQQNLYVILN